MLTVLALTVCSFSGLGCTDEELTAPRQAQQEVSVNTLITSDTICARAQFTITSATAVTTSFPNRATCTTKLVLIRGQAATWAQSPNRRLTLFVRLLNKSGQTLQMPVRLYLPANGITVTASAGTPASKVVPLGPDSVEAGGGKIWFVGGSGTLAANDSTVQDTIRVNVQSPVTKARFSFQASAATIVPGSHWPPLTNALPALDTSKTVTLSGDTTKYFRTELKVRFAPSVSDTVKEAVFSQLQMTVIGVTASGGFYVRVPDHGSSIAAFNAYFDSLTATGLFSNVAPLRRSAPLVEAFGRYPSDDSLQGQGRGTWTTNAASVWGMLATRMPLAWGCENGEYGSAPISVATLEAKQDHMHPEFLPSSPDPFEPMDVGEILKRPQLSSAKADSLIAHGTATTGTLTAKGDNTSGVAGTVWRSALHTYAIYSSGNRPISLDQEFWAISNEVIPDNVRILSISVDIKLDKTTTPAQRTSRIIDLAADVENLLKALPKLLIIEAAGDFKERGDYATYAAVDDALVLRAALLKLRSDPAYADRIIVVAGTRIGNAFWDQYAPNPAEGSGFYTGLTDIAAPAEDLMLLSKRVGSSIQMDSWRGTSFSAPMVAGVAAQLLAMDSSLTPADLKRYILLGAQAPRLDPSTGIYVAPPAVTGAPETIYQLDAYGALQLLSKERPGAPVCGLELAARFNISVGSNQAVIQRNTPDTVKSASGPITGQSFSLAQVGRLLAVDNRMYQLGSNNFWSLVHTESTADRIEFLEKDTAYISQQYNPVSRRTDALVRIGSATPGRSTSTQNVTAGFQGAAQSPLNAGGSDGAASTVSPTGDWVAVTWSYVDDEYLCPNAGGGDGSYLVPLRPGVGALYPFFTHTYFGCVIVPPPVRNELNTSITWRSDGGALFGARNFFLDASASYEYKLQEFQVGSGVSSLPGSSPVPGSTASLFWWAPEGGVLRYLETAVGGSGACYLISRSTSNSNLEFSRQLQTSNQCIGKPVLPLLRRGVRVAPNPAIAMNAARPPVLRRVVPSVMQTPMRIRAN